MAWIPPFYVRYCGVRHLNSYLRSINAAQTLIDRNIKSGHSVRHQYYYSKSSSINNFDWVLEEKCADSSDPIEVNLPVRQCHRTRDEFEQMKIKQIHTFCKHRDDMTYAASLGPTGSSAPFCTNPHDNTELKCGFRKRLIPEMPVVDQEVVKDFKKFVTKFLNTNFKPLPFKTKEKENNDFNHWIENQDHYPQTRKDSLREAFESLKTQGLENKDYHIKSFIKREFYEDVKFCRFINARSDRFLSRVASFIHDIEDQVYRLKYFVKHKDITQIPHLLAKLDKYKLKLETDYSSFESGFNPFITDACECELFRFFLQNNEDCLHDVLGCYYQIVNGKIIPRIDLLKNKEFFAFVQGSRMSGDLWTSLGNGFTNLMIMLFYAEKYHFKFEGMVEGDDGIFGMDQEYMKEKYYTDLGFKIKMQYVTNLCDTCFCGNLFDSHDLNLIISPEHLNRIFWTCNAQYLHAKSKLKEKLLRAKAMSMSILGKNTPIIFKLCYKILSLLGSGSLIEHDWWSRLKLRSYVAMRPDAVIPMSSRLLYNQHFGIPIDVQLLIENTIMSAKTIPELELAMLFAKSNWLNVDYVLPRNVLK